MKQSVYIALLRGINVSGRNIIKMDKLKHSIEQHGFNNVNTYLQSGNVIFTSDVATNAKPLSDQIGKIIKDEFDCTVPVMVFTIDDLEKAIQENPFADLYDAKFIHYTFLSATPEAIDIDKIKSKQAANEALFISNKVVYLYCPEGYGNTKLSNQFLEQQLKVTATTRNSNTTQALLSLAMKCQDAIAN